MTRRTSHRRTSRKLGSGSRFSALVRQLEARGDVADPRALAAVIGRRKYGKAGFAKLAAAGRRRSSLQRNPAHDPSCRCHKCWTRGEAVFGEDPLNSPSRVNVQGFLSRRAKVRDIVRCGLFRGQAKVIRISGDSADLKNELGGIHRGVPIDSLFVEPKGTGFGRKLRSNSNYQPYRGKCVSHGLYFCPDCTGERRRSSLRRNNRPTPKFKAGDMVQGMSGQMKLFGPQRVSSALYDGDMEEWTYYLPATRHTWVEGMLRHAKAATRRRSRR